MLICFRIDPAPGDGDATYAIVDRDTGRPVATTAAASDAAALPRIVELAAGRALVVEPALAAAAAPHNLPATELARPDLIHRAHAAVSARCNGMLDDVVDQRGQYVFFDAASQLAPILPRVRLWRAVVTIAGTLDDVPVDHHAGVVVVGAPESVVLLVQVAALAQLAQDDLDLERVDGLLVSFRPEPAAAQRALAAAYGLDWIPLPYASIGGRKMRPQPAELGLLAAAIEAAAANLVQGAIQLDLAPINGSVRTTVADVIAI
jgi:hypothetical protein